ncbi:adenine glycosylase [Streptococcus parauberis]|uniref:Adenine glycosylase n=1 Tax=Streptococcus parauberis TaxID=1348 RepID=A0AAE4KZV3_9STRE|nr:adenine glycosylase [Streptococcus parauberis]MDT2732402.1 adenine glycosylase [Streptococcus parauberis]
MLLIFFQTNLYTIVGEITVLLLVIGFFYQRHLLKKSKSANDKHKYSILIVFKDKERNIADYPEIAQLTDWHYNDNLKGYTDLCLENPKELTLLFNNKYNMNKKQVIVGLNRYSLFELAYK